MGGPQASYRSGADLTTILDTAEKPAAAALSQVIGGASSAVRVYRR
ncbi:hypothetical protein [Austwickia sp. TVS 96-490-7B]|nr:hypothetical protein [Austwickia sp. TVS 96-490-7B]